MADKRRINNQVLFIILVFTFCSELHGQVTDYKEIRKQLSTLSCGKVDSLELYHTKIRLETFDTTAITKNLDYYYRDLAMCYYKIFITHYDITYLKKDIEAYKKALFHQPNESRALWGCLFAYYKLGDCVNGKFYLELYKKYTDPKYWDPVQIERITKDCVN